MNGFFISMEGADGAGKTLQANLLLNHLLANGVKAIKTREPGGTPVGELIRNIIIDKNNREITALTEILLYAAARAQIVSELIKPSLNDGFTVICERFTDSSIAYQCYARGLDYDMVNRLNEYATGGLLPNITFFLDFPPERGIARKKQDAPLDRLELEGLSFQNKVYEGYKKIAENNPRIITVDASGSPEEVHLLIIEKLKEFEIGNNIFIKDGKPYI